MNSMQAFDQLQAVIDDCDSWPRYSASVKKAMKDLLTALLEKKEVQPWLTTKCLECGQIIIVTHEGHKEGCSRVPPYTTSAPDSVQKPKCPACGRYDCDLVMGASSSHRCARVGS